jgi:orotate phosphoribosyltransferase
MSMVEKRQELISLLAKYSLRYDAEGFLLASGNHSHWYLDCKTALSYAKFRQVVGDLIADLIEKDKPTAVGGLELGAYPIAAAVSDALYRRGSDEVRAFVVRKQPKKHGLQRNIEGHVRIGDRTIIVDDVTTTGSSTLDAYRHATAAELNVLKIVVIVDREESNGRKKIEATAGVRFEALCTLSEIVKAQEHEREYPEGDARSDCGAANAIESARTSSAR